MRLSSSTSSSVSGPSPDPWCATEERHMSWIGRRRDQAASPSRKPGRPLSACQPRISFTHGSWREFCRTTKNGGCAPPRIRVVPPDSPCAESRRSLHAAFHAAIEGGARAPTPPRRTCGTAATMPMRGHRAVFACTTALRRKPKQSHAEEYRGGIHSLSRCCRRGRLRICPRYSAGILKPDYIFSGSQSVNSDRSKGARVW